MQTPTSASTAEHRSSGSSRIRPEKLDGIAIPYSATVSALKALIGSQDPRRWAAFVALGHSTDLAAVSVLLQAATADDWEVRRAACEALGCRARSDLVANRVAERLRDPVPAVARTACSALAYIGRPEHRQQVLELLHHKNSATRVTAVRALEKLCPTTCETIIRNLARSHPLRDVRAAATAVLERRGAVPGAKAAGRAKMIDPFAATVSRAAPYVRPRYGIATS